MREGIPSGEMDIKFSTPFHDEQEPLLGQVEFPDDDKILSKREAEHSLETGLDFQDVRADVIQAQKVRSRRFSLLDQIKNRSLILASVLGIHAAPILLGDPELRSSMLEKAREMIASVQFGEKEQDELAASTKLLLAKDIKDFVHSSNESGTDQELVMQKLEDLHLKVLELKAGISPEEKAKTKEFIDGLRNKYTELHKKNILSDGSTLDHTLAELFEFSKDTGRYESEMARLSDIANKGAGNCESKALLRRLILPSIFPGNKIKFQHFGVGEKTLENQAPTDAAGHIRVIMEIGTEWYALEDGVPKKLSPEDLVGTQITDIDIFEKSILGEKIGSNPVKSSGEVPRESTFKTNSLYSIQFEHPPTRSAPAGSSTQAETSEEYVKRQRLEYTAGGNTIDPQNLPPLKLYIGDTIEEVASQMGGGEKKVEDPNKKVEISQKQKMEAMIDGTLNLFDLSHQYDFSSLSGVDVQDIRLYSSHLSDTKINQVKILEEINKNFPQLQKLQVGMVTNKESDVLKNFTKLRQVHLNLENNISNIDFLSSNDNLTEVNLLSYSTKGTISLEPLRGKKLERLQLINVFDRGGFTGFDAIETDNLQDVSIAINSSTNEGSELIFTSPHLQRIEVEFSAKGDVQSFLDSFSLRTHELKNFEFGSHDRPFQFDLQKLSGQPLQKLNVTSGLVTHFEALQGMPVRELEVYVDCKSTDFSVLKTLTKLVDLDITCSGEIPESLDSLVSSLHIRRAKVHQEFDNDSDEDYRHKIVESGGY